MAEAVKGRGHKLWHVKPCFGEGELEVIFSNKSYFIVVLPS